MIDHDVDDLICIFNGLFQRNENTRLIKGGDEPIYLPACQQHTYHQIVFAHGFYASALHEIAHWCVAGPERRQCVDYGYWYEPDGRTSDQQRAFERVEARPQALEWILAKAAGFKFNISVDNLGGEPVDRRPFAKAVLVELSLWFERGLPDRAQILVAALRDYYHQAELARESFSLSEVI